MLRVTVFWAISGLIGMAAAVYIADTVLYLTPPNPLKADLVPAINRLMYPLFAQNWHLFAPNPVRTNFVVTARCRTRGIISPWLDLTQPMLALHHRHRNSPVGRVLRVRQNAARMALGSTFDEWRELACRRDPHQLMCRPGRAAERAQEIGMYLLGRIATSACNEVSETRGAEAIQVRILIHQPPFWSRRHLSDHEGVTRYVVLPWVPVER